MSLINLSMAYLDMEDNEENRTKAIRYARSAWETDKNNLELNFKYGLVLMQTGELYRAIERLENAYKLDNSNLKAQMAISECYLKLDKIDKALNNLEKYADKKSEDRDYLMIELMIYSKMYEKNKNEETKLTIINICDKILEKYGENQLVNMTKKNMEQNP